MSSGDTMVLIVLKHPNLEKMKSVITVVRSLGFTAIGYNQMGLKYIGPKLESIPEGTLEFK